MGQWECGICIHARDESSLSLSLSASQLQLTQCEMLGIARNTKLLSALKQTATSVRQHINEISKHSHLYSLCVRHSSSMGRIIRGIK